MPPTDRAPQIVIDLAASVSGEPLRWYEYDDHWVILMTDGRKVHFKKEHPSLPRRRDTLSNYKPGATQNQETRPDGKPRQARKHEE